MDEKLEFTLAVVRWARSHGHDKLLAAGDARRLGVLYIAHQNVVFNDLLTDTSGMSKTAEFLRKNAKNGGKTGKRQEI